MLFSVITPTAGRRPRALAQAAASVRAAVEAAGLSGRVEHLVGFDGAPASLEAAMFDDLLRPLALPKCPGSFGNAARQILIAQARGGHLLFVDDDNALLPNALASFLPHLGQEMIIARIDTSRAFDVPFLPRPPRPGSGAEEAVRQGDIDPLCLCLARELVLVRCRGWQDEGGYESDFLNIRRYFRRARGVVRIDDVVGVYDAGRGLDEGGLNSRQALLPPPA